MKVGTIGNISDGVSAMSAAGKQAFAALISPGGESINGPEAHNGFTTAMTGLSLSDQLAAAQVHRSILDITSSGAVNQEYLYNNGTLTQFTSQGFSPQDAAALSASQIAVALLADTYVPPVTTASSYWPS